MSAELAIVDAQIMPDPMPRVDVYVGYLKRGNQFVRDVLIPGGLTANKGTTATGKLKKYFLAAAGTDDLKEITVPQWEAILAQLGALAREGNEIAAAAVQQGYTSYKPNERNVTKPSCALKIDNVEVELTDPKAVSWSGTIEEWASEVARVSVEVKNIQFYFGDLINQGVEAFGEVAAYMSATRASGRDRETLRFYAWVARKVPPARRVEGLTFNHHRAVAALHPAIQSTLLDRAVEENLSVKAVQEIASFTTVEPTYVAGKSNQKGVRCLVAQHIFDLLVLIVKTEIANRPPETGWVAPSVETLAERAITMYALAYKQRALKEAKEQAARIPAGSSSEPA